VDFKKEKGEGYYLPILKSLVPHFGQVPDMAGRLFFKVTRFGFDISLFFRHFTQYAVTIWYESRALSV
jgi:hypothetical protein